MGMKIEGFVTKAPFTIARTATLAEAHRRMSEHSIRHLPVLDAGALVGIVSMGDLHLVETFRDVDKEKAIVEEAMTPDPYVIRPKDEVADVVLTMAEHKYGSAVVVDERGHVAGIFTAIDGLRLLAVILREGAKAKRPPAARAKAPAAKAAARKAAAKKKPAKNEPARKKPAKRR